MVALAYLTCGLVWGTTWFFIRVSIGPGGYSTYTAAALRFTIAALVLGALWLRAPARHAGPKSWPQLGWLVVCGVLDAASYGLFYTAEESIPGGLAAVVFGTYPLVMALVAAATGTEQLSLSSVAGALLGLGGIAVIFAERLSVSAAQATGVALVLCGVVASTVYNIIFKRKASDLSPIASSAVFLAVTAVALWGVAGVTGQAHLPWPPPARPSAAVLYLALVGSVVAFVAYFWMIQRISLNRAATLVFIQPVIALGVDALFEHEVRLVPRTYLGVGLTLTGVLVGLLLRQTR
jgi:drug/metabolite transporter (DMT)-like permease